MDEQTRTSIGPFEQGKKETPVVERENSKTYASRRYPKETVARKKATRMRAVIVLPDSVEGATWIPLTKGLFALVDSSIADEVKKFSWHALLRPRTHYAARSYRVGGIKKSEFLHRFIMQTPKGVEVDHINASGWDCRKTNMRNCGRSENCFNARKRLASTTSAFKGVCFNKRSKTWYAQIRAGKAYKFVGSFSSERDAAKAYNKAAMDLCPKFANLNVIPPC